MVAITFGQWVFFDRHYGIAVGSPGELGKPFGFRHTLLKNVERLIEIDGFEKIIEVVARHLGADRELLVGDVRQAYSYFDNQIIRDCWHGAAGPLAAIGGGSISVEQLRAIVEVEEVKAAGRIAKKVHIKIRRSEFAGRRADLVLAMLDAGVPYVCAHAGCGITLNLTVDHKRALSRGGTDDLSNLQFLCGSHNSKKRDGP